MKLETPNLLEIETFEFEYSAFLMTFLSHITYKYIFLHINSLILLDYSKINFK
jgi:hypothetical protein